MELKGSYRQCWGCGSRLVIDASEKLGRYTPKDLSNPLKNFEGRKLSEAVCAEGAE